MTTIYISSTYEDLVTHRKKVHDALVACGYTVIAMEHYVAKDKRPVDDCLADVARSDIHVGIYGMRYGYVPPRSHNNPDGLSITELELRQAESQPKTWCIAFLSDPEGPQPPQKFIDALSQKRTAPKIKRLRDHLRQEKEAPYFDYDNPDALANVVQQAITNYQVAPGRVASEQAPGPPPITWNVEKHGPPYPGLLHFTPDYASVFFGRETAIREVIDRLHNPVRHFVVVSGSSGSGKSSLVDAGVRQQLKSQNGLGDQSVDWVYIRPSDGIDCFDALCRALTTRLQAARFNSVETWRELAAAQPNAFAKTLKSIVSGGCRADTLILFIDQMEELFAAGPATKDLTDRFLTGLQMTETAAQVFVSVDQNSGYGVVGEPRVRTHQALDETRAHNLAVAVDGHVADHAQSIDVRVQ